MSTNEQQACETDDAPIPDELLLGVVVNCGRHCRHCGNGELVISRLRVGPHAAALNCPICVRFADWLPKGAMD